MSRWSIQKIKAKLLEIRTRVSNNLEKFLFLLLDVTPITSMTGIISLPECVDSYTKVKLFHRTLDVHHSYTYLLSFTIANNFLHFFNNLTGTIPENPLNYEWKNIPANAKQSSSLVNSPVTTLFRKPRDVMPVT